MTEQVKAVIEAAYERIAEITPLSVDTVTREAVLHTIDMLDQGKIRVAEKVNGEWVVNQWVKKAVLLYFRINENVTTSVPGNMYYDKVDLKYSNYTAEDFKRDGVRAVPGCVVRKGAYVSKDVVLMPSFVNIGGYVGEGTMVDTWVTVGSCAQVGKHVHLSGGAGILLDQRHDGGAPRGRSGISRFSRC